MLYNIVSLAFLACTSRAYPSSTLGQSTALNARQDTTNLNTSAACPEPKVRKEWRDLEPALQQEYLSAVKCLTTKPAAINTIPGASLYDDFSTVHQSLADSIHFTAVFLPWHRYFVHIYESALRDCGYTGTQPYWDWTRDVGPHVDQSPIFDVVNGFGGTGINPSEASPISEGPFSNFTVYTPSEHKLSRLCDLLRFFPYSPTKIGLSPPHSFSTYTTVNGTLTQAPAFVNGSMNSQNYSPEVVERIIAAGTSYDTFRRPFESGPHGLIHVTIGADMVPSRSPNDPLFFAHHTQVDRVWWHWQQRNPSLARDYSGPTVQNSDVQDAAVADLMPYQGLNGVQDVVVDDVILSNTAELCYLYAD